MNSTKRVLLVSASMVLLCLCIIVGATYALFTDSVTVHNHLQAGDLDLRFERTNLEYAVLKTDGTIEVVKETGVVDFTDTSIDFTNTNIFGINDERVIVPTSFVKADLRIANDGNVAFDYKVFLLLKDGISTDLAKQLLVTVSSGNNVLVSKKPLSEMATGEGYVILSGSTVKTTSEVVFTVHIEFADDVVDNTIDDNDLAQDQAVAFDLSVSAVQSTSATVNP